MLRGLGATLALPLLDSMVPALTARRRRRRRRRRRFGVVYVPNGMVMQEWTPAAEGAGFEFTPALKPLEPFRDRIARAVGPRQQAAGRGAERRRRACARLDALSHRHPAEALRHLRRRRPASRWIRSLAQELGRPDAARLARAGHRRPRPGRLVRHRVQLRLHQHHLLARDRRRRCRWRTIRASSSSGCSATAAAPIARRALARIAADRSILDSVARSDRRAAAAASAPRDRGKLGRVPRGGPRHRAAHPARPRNRAAGSCRWSISRRACRPASKNTRS